MSWADRIATHLATARDRGRWRTIRTVDDGSTRTRLTSDGTSIVSFASNDYLGLSQHPTVIDAARDALDRWGTGAGAARLIVGGRPVHDELEAELASWCERDAALLFPTGFQANLGVLGALVEAAGRDDVVVLSDELNHASIIDGIRGARARVAVYRHGDVDHVRQLLDTHDPSLRLVVSDAVFSMDGDTAPLDDLAKVCDEAGALLVVDAAHRVLGPEMPDGAIVVGTLSKTLGSLGGFVAASHEVVDLCRNAARSFIFTTASTPADTAAALAALRIVRSPEGDDLRARLRAHVELIEPGHPSPIIAVVLGDEDVAMAASHHLLAEGLLVPAIRPPTVASGTSRLRVALSAAHDAADVERLADLLQALPRLLGVLRR
ncbi:MAG TPA: 8-amino-7-oxononanoate synthase [Microthrixaceae bacterium]|nr:8-amino-7-oxononanoate synthase [Microthrixaceae bacterium]